LKAIQVVDPGKASSLEVAEVSAPEDVAGAVRIRVAAAGVNRADLMQRRGLYPPPPGASEILGLECAGIVEAVAPDVSDWAPGDRVMALLAGGGYAEQVVADAGSLLRVPDSMSLEAAAGVPEVFLTVYLNVFQLAGLGPGESLLVHGGGSGIGTTAIQLAKEAGARVFVTAGSEEKCARCVKLGADAAFDYREGDFAQKVLEATSGRGVDVILDHIGGRYLDANLRSLATGGRQVTIGLMGGARAELDLGRMLARRLQLFGSTLRARSATEKAALASAFIRRFGEALSSGRIAPVIEKVWPLAEAESAHQQMEASTHFGKIILAVGS
jgi:putative PIG3 family NAD(P)H quinone oxidoreductase